MPNLIILQHVSTIYSALSVYFLYKVAHVFEVVLHKLRVGRLELLIVIIREFLLGLAIAYFNQARNAVCIDDNIVVVFFLQEHAGDVLQADIDLLGAAPDRAVVASLNEAAYGCHELLCV